MFLKIAKKLLKKIDEEKGNLRIDALKSIDGIGTANACKIMAAIEFVKRRIRPKSFKINKPSDVIKNLAHCGDRKQEYFLCIYINGANEIIKTRVITIGLVNSIQVHFREVFDGAITDRQAVTK